MLRSSTWTKCLALQEARFGGLGPLKATSDTAGEPPSMNAV